MDSTDVADDETDAVSACTQEQLRASACTDRIGLGTRASQKVLTLQRAMPKESGFKQTLCTEMTGRSLYAYLPCGATIAKRWNSFSSTSPAGACRPADATRSRWACDDLKRHREMAPCTR